MRNLNWIKDFYALDTAKEATVPPERTRYISLSIALTIGMYAWLWHANGIPMLIAVSLWLLMFMEPINLKFFKATAVTFQIIFQTLRIIIMSFLYYTIFALAAMYFRRKKLEGTSFIVKDDGTIRKLEKLNINWEKMW